MKHIMMTTGDLQRALKELMKNDIKEFDKEADNANARLKYALKEFDGMKRTVVTPQEEALLKKNNFLPPPLKRDPGYEDFHGDTIQGFGDNNDRQERITYSIVSNRWYAVVEHIDGDGNEWYYASTQERKSLKETLKDLMADRESAPKKVYSKA